MLINFIINPFSCQVVADANYKTRTEDKMLKLKWCDSPPCHLIFNERKDVVCFNLNIVLG